MLFYNCLGQYYWNEKYYFNNPAANGQSIVYDSFTNKFIVAGATLNQEVLSYLQSINPDGSENDMKIISQDDSILNIFDQGSMSIYDNHYYVTGVKYYESIHKQMGLLVKYNSNLDTLFTKTYDGDANYDDFVPRFSQAENDSIFIVGELSKGVNNTLIDVNGLLIIADSNGNELKRVVYGGNTYREYLYDIQKAGNNWVCMASKEKSLGQNAAHQYMYDWRGVVLLYDHAGTLINSYTTPEQDVWGQSVTATKDGGYAFCGIKLPHIVLDTLGGGTFLHKGYIEKINANMQREWTLTLSHIDTTAKTELYKIIENPDGTLVVAGTDVDQKNEKHISGWMVKISAQGQVLWQRHHKVVYTAEEEHFFNDMCKAPDGGYVLAGVALDFTPYTPQNPVGAYAWVCKTDSFGCLVPGCQLVGIAADTDLGSSLKLYPNPASDRLFLYYNNPQLHNCVFSIADMAGRVLVPKTALENTTTYEIPIREWAQGVYFLQVQDEKGNIHTEKFIKE